MLIVEQRTKLQTAPVFIFTPESDVAICETIKETYLTGDKILAVAVIDRYDSVESAKLVRCLLCVSTHWGFPALLRILDLQQLDSVKIVICTETSNYEIYNGNVRTTVKLPLVVGHRLGLLKFLYHRLGFTAEFSVAMTTAIQKWHMPKATTKVFLSKGFIHPSEETHRFNFIKAIFSIVGAAVMSAIRFRV